MNECNVGNLVLDWEILKEIEIKHASTEYTLLKLLKKLFLSINTSNKRAPFNPTYGRTLRFIFLIYFCSPFFFRRLRRHHQRCCYCPFFVLHRASQSCITRWHSYALVFISVSFDFFIYTKCSFLDHWHIHNRQQVQNIPNIHRIEGFKTL